MKEVSLKRKIISLLFSFALALVVCWFLMPIKSYAAVTQITDELYMADNLITGNPYIGSTIETKLEFWIEANPGDGDIWMERYFDWGDVEDYGKCAWFYTPKGSAENIVITDTTFSDAGHSQLLLKPEWYGGYIKVVFYFPDGVTLTSNAVEVSAEPGHGASGKYTITKDYHYSPCTTYYCRNETHKFYYGEHSDEDGDGKCDVCGMIEINSITITGSLTDIELGNLVNDTNRNENMKTDSPHKDLFTYEGIKWYVLTGDYPESSIRTDLGYYRNVFKEVYEKDARFETGQIYVGVLRYRTKSDEILFSEDINATLNGEQTAVFHDNYGNIRYIEVMYIYKRFTPNLTIEYTMPDSSDVSIDYTYSSDYQVYVKISRYNEGHKYSDEPNGIWTNDPLLFKEYGIEEDFSDSLKDACVQNKIGIDCHWFTEYEEKYDYELTFIIESNLGNRAMACPNSIKVNNSSIYLRNSYWDGVYTDPITIHPVTAEVGVAQIRGYSISLSEQVGVHFFMDMSDAALKDEKAYMVFNVAGAEQIVSVKNARTRKMDGRQYYIFSCAVAPKQLTDTITAQFVMSDGKSSKVYSFTVEDYIMHLYKGNSLIYDSYVLRAVMGLNLYGYYSQLYFGYNTDNLVDISNVDIKQWDTNMFESLGIKESRLDIDAVNDRLSSMGISIFGSSLVLDANVRVKMYLSMTEEAEAAIKSGAIVINSSYELKKVSPGIYYIESAPANPVDVGEGYGVALEFTIKSGGKSEIIRYSIYQYCDRVLRDDEVDTNLKNLICAYIYYAYRVYLNDVAVSV